MVMNKKAIIFSLIAIGISGLFILIFSSSMRPHVNDHNEIVRTRVNGLDQTITDFYSYTQAAQEVAGYAALEALYRKINDTYVFPAPPTYLPDFEQAFVDCTNSSKDCQNPQNLTLLLNQYTSAIEKAKDITFNFTVNSIKITDELYWSIVIETNISINLTDRYATWHYNQNVTSRISLNGIHDPAILELHSMYGGTKERKIYPAQFNTDLGTPIITDIMDMYTITQYHHSHNGSCISQRFEGDFDGPAEECGLETFLNPEEFPDLKDDPLNQEILHLDWQAIRSIEETTCADRFNITGINGAFHLNETTTERYGLSDYLSTPSC
jgi:hypothetical protein